MEKIITVKLSVLQKLPKGNIDDIVWVENMDGKKVKCFIMRWFCDGTLRYSSFSTDTGDYCGEYLDKHRSIP